jgi:hypothetical protein
MKAWIKDFIKRKQKSSIRNLSNVIERQNILREKLGKGYEDTYEYASLDLKRNWLIIVVKFWYIWI